MSADLIVYTVRRQHDDNNTTDHAISATCAHEALTIAERQDAGTADVWYWEIVAINGTPYCVNCLTEGHTSTECPEAE
jgi:hypothetical protein